MAKSSASSVRERYSLRSRQGIMGFSPGAVATTPKDVIRSPGVQSGHGPGDPVSLLRPAGGPGGRCRGRVVADPGDGAARGRSACPAEAGSLYRLPPERPRLALPPGSTRILPDLSVPPYHGRAGPTAGPLAVRPLRGPGP